MRIRTIFWSCRRWLKRWRTRLAGPWSSLLTAWATCTPCTSSTSSLKVGRTATSKLSSLSERRGPAWPRPCACSPPVRDGRPRRQLPVTRHAAARATRWKSPSVLLPSSGNIWVCFHFFVPVSFPCTQATTTASQWSALWRYAASSALPSQPPGYFLMTTLGPQIRSVVGLFPLPHPGLFSFIGIKCKNSISSHFIQ